MSLISLIVAVAIVGFLVWVILQIPMPDPFRKIIISIVCFFLILWVLQALGIATGRPSLRLR